MPPLLNLSEVIVDVDLSDTITVIRRTETVGNDGFSSVAPKQFYPVYAIVYPIGRNELNRGEDADLTFKTINVYTTFRLQATSPGIKPDLVQWSGDTYVVVKIEDYNRFGTGFIQARCTSIKYQDEPPAP